MPSCPQCKNEYDLKDSFCPYCGAAIEKKDQSVTFRRFIQVLVIGGDLFLLLQLFFFLSYRSKLDELSPDAGTTDILIFLTVLCLLNSVLLYYVLLIRKKKK